MEKNIVLVGCGNIGIYHLQSLIELKENCNIQVVEPNLRSIETGKQRIEKSLERNSQKVQVVWMNDISKVTKNADLTVIATCAGSRVDTLSRLISMGHKRFLVEKMVCQSVDEYEQLLSSMDEHKAKGWVNCSRRYCDFYKSAASVLHQDDTPIIFSAKAGNLGLGCNAVHFLDLFSWFSRDGKSIKLDGRYIFPELFPNRRSEDLVEFAGTITGETQSKDFVTISFLPDSDIGASVNVLNKDVEICVNENSEKAFMSDRESNWVRREYPFRLPYTSEITRRVTEDIFAAGSCDLPTVEDMFSLHKELFHIFNSAIERVTDKRPTLCPIT